LGKLKRWPGVWSCVAAAFSGGQRPPEKAAATPDETPGHRFSLPSGAAQAWWRRQAVMPLLQVAPSLKRTLRE
ncbi:MAG: hypothetical protein D6775_01720, partial [Caldilineae bacterium]